MKEQLSVVLVALGIAALFAVGAGVLIHKRSLNAAAQESAEASPPEPSPVGTVPPVQPLPVIAAAPAPITPADTPTPKSSRAFERAKQLVVEGRDAEARHVLERRVRRGAGSVDETRLLRELCKSARDQSCLDDIKAHYPGM